ncbi:MAG: hypothetical protein QOE95_341 [Gaiellaceae bacterium]|nr:hypothetical protein [Gaiellaceae bacterium]
MGRVKRRSGAVLVALIVLGSGASACGGSGKTSPGGGGSTGTDTVMTGGTSTGTTTGDSGSGVGY